ncbi:MAG TPA: ATP-dependent zinc metalloprotease FtsH [Noviherbaspirillum sp.]|nr:ATP-dependent zinc metalloprotease FtsH [Noviherbaspirillum sp.]
MKEDKNLSTAPRTPFWYWLLIPAMFLLFQSIAEMQSVSSLAYSDFKQLLYAGKVREATLTDETITGMINADGLDKILPKQQREQLKCSDEQGCPFKTVRVTDPDLLEAMETAGVRVVGQTKNHWFSTLLWWMLPILLFLWLWGMLAKKAGMAAGGLFDIGKSKARVYVASTTGVTFDDVAGIDEAKDELIEVVEFLKTPERYCRLGGKIPKGVLIVGPPGTGKTLLAKAVAGEAGVPFFSISGSEFVEMFVGVGAARVRDLFAQAEQKAPCLIFIDELDALGKARGVAGVVGGYNEQEQTLNQLLVEMDGFETNKGVIILAATNRPEILDPALLRPGRFDRHIALDRPDLKGREKILTLHARQVTLSNDVDLSVIAARTAGFAGADLANLVNEAALLAGRRGKDRVDMNDFDEAIDRIVAGLQKKTRVMNKMEKETVAFHEAGHALIAESRRHADRVEKISIIPRGIAALGYTQQLPTEDRYLLKKAELLDRMDVFLGGRVAEEIVFGDVSTGAQNDLQLANDMARHMIIQYGMSDRLGLATFGQTASPLIYPPSLQEKRGYSESTAQIIDREIGKLLDEAHVRVKETLMAKRELLDTLAHALLEKETLDRAALDALLKERDKRAIRRIGSTDY